MVEQFDSDVMPDELGQVQPPPGMRETRILSAPEGVAVYTPPEDASPNDLVVCRYHDFFGVVRELAGSQLQAFNIYAAKLQAAVVTNGADVVRSLVLATLPSPVEDRPAMAVEFPTQEDYQETLDAYRKDVETVTEARLRGEFELELQARFDAGFSAGMEEGVKQQVAAGTAAGSIDLEKPASEDVKVETTDVPSDASSPTSSRRDVSAGPGKHRS